MSTYQINMGNVQNCAIGPGASVHTIPLEIKCDPELWDRAVDKARKQGVKIDVVIDRLLREYADDDPEPEAVPA